MKALEEKIEIMQAYLDGKEVEIYNDVDDPCYWESISNPEFNWEYNDYRIKPENKQVPFDCKNAFELTLQRFKHVEDLNEDEADYVVCVFANYKGVMLADKLVRYEELAKSWLKWNTLLNRWESCTKTVKE